MHPATPEKLDAFHAFYNTPLGKTPANAVRLALEDHRSHNNGRGIAEFESQLARAARILDVFETHRFTLARLTMNAATVDKDVAAAEAHQAFIDAVR